MGLLVLALLLTRCGGGKPASLADVFPGADALPGWTPVGAMEIYDRENIYDLVDGQADAFFAYGFEQVAVQSYENADGTLLRVEIWQLATEADAYGLFTAQLAGTPVAIGPSTGSGRRYDGDADPGRRLAFWQDRHYVHVHANQELNDADLRGFAEAVSTALPPGGERPALIGRLPPDGLVERSAIFFHEELSIQNELWLGGENLLGLGQETDGILARYSVHDGIAHLLLAEYPDAAAASAGLAVLESGRVDGLVTAQARDNLLGAIFGEMDEAAASALLAEALSDG